MSTAGKRSNLVQTERTRVSTEEFQRGIIDLAGDTENLAMLIHADSNAGKTVLAGTSPGKVLWLVGERGYKSAPRVAKAKGKARKLTSTAMAWAALEWLESGYAKKLDWCILDGLSTLQTQFRLNYAAEAFDANPAKRQHRNLPDKPDYFNTQNMLKAWIPRFVDLPCNVIITCHSWRTDATDADLLVFPGIQGKVTEVSNEICGLMDIVGYLEVRKDKKSGKEYRRLWTQRQVRNDVTYIAGDKTGSLGRFMDNPSIPKILSKVNGEEEE